MLTKSGHFWTTNLPRLVKVVCEQPLKYLSRSTIFSNLFLYLVGFHSTPITHNFSSIQLTISYLALILTYLNTGRSKKTMFPFLRLKLQKFKICWIWMSASIKSTGLGSMLFTMICIPILIPVSLNISYSISLSISIYFFV